jgi:hypothetical protein
MTTERTRQFQERLPDGHPLRQTIADCLSIAERFAAKRAELAQSGRLTSAGQAAALREMLPGFARELGKAKEPLTKLQSEIKARRSAMKPKEPDPANLAAAIERAEIRTWLRSLDLNARQTVLLTAIDHRLLEAALSAPPELSGLGQVSKSFASEVEQRFVELTCADELKAVDDLEYLVAEANSAAIVARVEMQRAADLDDRTFEGIVGPAEGGAGLPWLVGSDDHVRVVEIGPDRLANYRPATDWERSVGKFYKNAAEYDAANAA